MSGPRPTLSRPVGPRPSIGWPLMPVPDETGALGWPDLDASVRQSIEMILRVTPGERLMRPAFGAGLEALIDQPNTLETRARAQAAVIEALRRHEPRILLDDVAVDPGADERELLITLSYRLRPTGTPVRLTARAPVGGA
ncbi:GPW/gp25 family protein [Albimonas sp. CAU 1670]|uniref:GPW/gp25 family protein n=1 Tax=Albimonas sp. CAU 1670 TaxID=3032599 RepID=UPI0023DCD54F|nr:GPW/gp25 family protein [Albimonas sp. CAU 1670]MDF2235421.1 GPW/gp25 family protein [Albimonas sp. CAU 1670]